MWLKTGLEAQGRADAQTGRLQSGDVTTKMRGGITLILIGLGSSQDDSIWDCQTDKV